jgi:hypothetical protein
MSSAVRARVSPPLLLAAALTVGGALETPAAAQRVEVFVNGQRVTDVVINGRVNGFRNGAVNGFRNGARIVNGRQVVVNGTRIVNGARVVNGANGGNGLRTGFHSHSHVGPYDECFRDRMTGRGHCTGRYWGRHSGPHRGLHRNGRVVAF